MAENTNEQIAAELQQLDEKEETLRAAEIQSDDKVKECQETLKKAQDVNARIREKVAAKLEGINNRRSMLSGLLNVTKTREDMEMMLPFVLSVPSEDVDLAEPESATGDNEEDEDDDDDVVIKAKKRTPSSGKKRPKSTRAIATQQAEESDQAQSAVHGIGQATTAGIPQTTPLSTAQPIVANAANARPAASTSRKVRVCDKFPQLPQCTVIVTDTTQTSKPYVELRCPLCEGNLSPGKGGTFIKGVTGFQRHMEQVHNNKMQAEEVFKMCVLREVPVQEIDQIRNGQHSIKKDMCKTHDEYNKGATKGRQH